MSIQHVIESLDQLNGIHVDLLKLGEQKKQVLINNEVNELTLILNKESKLMKQVAEHEQQWLEYTSSFLKEKGFKPNPSMTMTELIKLVYKAEEKQALLDAQQKLLNTIQKLQELNALNKQLIEQSLSFIDYTLDIMTDSPDEGMLYQRPTRQQTGSKRKGIFDTKA